MATLIIPDIHERVDKLEKIDRLADKADRVVFLGDWFDCFKPYSEERIKTICEYLMNGQRKDDLLLGNHDVHYFYDNAGYICSGYEPRKKTMIRYLLPPEVIAQFQIYTLVGPYHVSHAGFCEATIQYARPEVEAEAIRKAEEGGYDPIFGAGRARGGNQKWGGPTWLDWEYEFDHIEDWPQIVGHTHGKDVRAKGMTKADSKVNRDGDVTVDVGLMSYCIDTGLRHCALVDEETGAIEIIDI